MKPIKQIHGMLRLTVEPAPDDMQARLFEIGKFDDI